MHGWNSKNGTSARSSRQREVKRGESPATRMRVETADLARVRLARTHAAGGLAGAVRGQGVQAQGHAKPIKGGKFPARSPTRGASHEATKETAARSPIR